MDMISAERSHYEGLDYGPRLGRKIDLGLRDIDPKTLKQALEENRKLGKKAGLGLEVKFSEDVGDIEAVTLSERAGRELNELVSIVKDEGGQFHFASGQKIDLESLGVYRRKLAVLSKELKRQIEGGGRFGAAEPAVQKAMILLTVIGVLTSACSPALAAEGISTAQPSVTATKEVPATSTTEATIESPIATPTATETESTPTTEAEPVNQTRLFLRKGAESVEVKNGGFIKEVSDGRSTYIGGKVIGGSVVVEDDIPANETSPATKTVYVSVRIIGPDGKEDILRVCIGRYVPGQPDITPVKYPADFVQAGTRMSNLGVESNYNQLVSMEKIIVYLNNSDGLPIAIEIYWPAVRDIEAMSDAEAGWYLNAKMKSGLTRREQFYKILDFLMGKSAERPSDLSIPTEGNGLVIPGAESVFGRG